MNELARMVAMSWGASHASMEDPDEFGQKVKQVYLACCGAPSETTLPSATDSELLKQIAEDCALIRRVLSESVEFSGLVLRVQKDQGSGSTDTPVLGA